MKAPDGTIDLIGSGMALASGIVGLVKDFSPDADTRKANRLRRRVNLAIRRFKHKYKGRNIESYVNLNFSDYDQFTKDNIILELKSLL